MTLTVQWPGERDKCRCVSAEDHSFTASLCPHLYIFQPLQSGHWSQWEEMAEGTLVWPGMKVTCYRSSYCQPGRSSKWGGGAPKAEGFFCLPQHTFVLFLDLLPLHVFWSCFPGGGGCFWSVDAMLEMLLKPTDFLSAANSCCPWRSCPLSARLYLPSNLA